MQESPLSCTVCSMALASRTRLNSWQSIFGPRYTTADTGSGSDSRSRPEDGRDNKCSAVAEGSPPMGTRIAQFNGHKAGSSVRRRLAVHQLFEPQQLLPEHVIRGFRQFIESVLHVAPDHIAQRDVGAAGYALDAP